jgi:6-phospho-beta-glucosidase
MEILTILGGGSAYTPGLLQALIGQPGQPPLHTVRLYDTDPARLDVVARLCAGMARSAGAPFVVQPAFTLEAAVRGAGLVLNSTRPGGLAGRRIDETLPLEFDIPGQETVGPGGFFYALRSVPEALRVADAMAALAPGAILLNYTNPSNIVSQALADQGKVRVIGMCDQSDEDLESLALAMGRTGHPSFRCNGLNHATWYSDVAVDGAPLGPWPPTLAAPQQYDEEHRLRFACSLALAREQPDGYWPNSYLPYYLFPHAFVAQARLAPPRSDVVAASLPRYYAHFAEQADLPEPRLRFYRGGAGFGDMAANLIAALGADSPRELVLNLPNQGATSAFSDDTVIETKALVSRHGIERLAAPALQSSFAALAASLENYQRLSARAAAGRGFAPRVAALAANPLVGDVALASRMLTAARSRYGNLIEWES